jgi:hypothetical protein
MQKLFLLLLTTGIVQAQTIETIETIKFDPTSQPKGQLMLSDLAGSVEYIPLETRDECILVAGTEYQEFDVSDNYILISSGITGDVFLFKRNGRFVTKVGRKGQGPGEYLNSFNVYIDEPNGQLIVIDAAFKALFYGLNGKHIRTLSTPIRNEWHLAYFKNRFLTGLSSGMLKDRDTCVFKVWDGNFNLLRQGVKAIPVTPVGEWAGNRIAFSTYPIPIVCYQYEGYPNVRESSLNDTVYRINNNTFTPRYILDQGKYKATPEMKADVDLWRRVIKDGTCMGIISLHETKQYLLFKYDYKRVYFYGYYDKQSKRVQYFDAKDGIPDDYTGGINFWPWKQKDDMWYAFYDAPNLLERYAKKKELTPKGPAATTQKLKRILHKLDTEDNPVLIIVKIKQ